MVCPLLYVIQLCLTQRTIYICDAATNYDEFEVTEK